MNSEDNLEAVSVRPKTGQERFHEGADALEFGMIDFWRWNQSDLLENRTRGILAEFLVHRALGLTSATRTEWDSVDLKMEDNTLIEVKSAAYLQTWKQKKYSAISFDISPKRIYQEDLSLSKTKHRSADIYVFCLLDHKDQTTVNPLDLNQWKFFVLATQFLNEKLPGQKTVRISTLLNLGCEPCGYGQLKEVIERIKG